MACVLSPWLDDDKSSPSGPRWFIPSCADDSLPPPPKRKKKKMFFSDVNVRRSRHAFRKELQLRTRRPKLEWIRLCAAKIRHVSFCIAPIPKPVMKKRRGAFSPSLKCPPRSRCHAESTPSASRQWRRAPPSELSWTPPQSKRRRGVKQYGSNDALNARKRVSFLCVPAGLFMGLGEPSSQIHTAPGMNEERASSKRT